MAAAARLPGAALPLACLLGWQAGVQRRSTNLAITRGILADVGVSPRAYYRALIALEAAGLITVIRRPGCRARVSLVSEDLP